MVSDTAVIGHVIETVAYLGPQTQGGPRTLTQNQTPNSEYKYVATLH